MPPIRKATAMQGRAAKKTELTELARQSAEAYIDAQKKLLDVATQQLKVNGKTAGEAINALNPLPVETLVDLTKHAVSSLVESQHAWLDLIYKPAHPKEHAAAEDNPKPRKRPASAKSRAAKEKEEVVETV